MTNLAHTTNLKAVGGAVSRRPTLPSLAPEPGLDPELDPDPEEMATLGAGAGRDVGGVAVWPLGLPACRAFVPTTPPACAWVYMRVCVGEQGRARVRGRSTVRPVPEQNVGK